MFTLENIVNVTENYYTFRSAIIFELYLEILFVCLDGLSEYFLISKTMLCFLLSQVFLCDSIQS